MNNSVVCFLERTAECYPNKIAIVEGEQSITFRELRENAISLAVCILEKGIQGKAPVLVFLPKGISAIISFMAVLYSGNIYSPTEVEYTEARLKTVMTCLQPALILTNRKYLSKLLEMGIAQDNILLVDEKREFTEADKVLVQVRKTIDTDIAYILFTSGSTGVPKGVSISHRSIVDFVDWLIDEFHVDSSLIIGNQAPFYFDNSVMDIYLMLAVGAELHIIPKSFFRFPRRLMEYVCQTGINHVLWVPSVLESVANYNILEDMEIPSLKTIFFAGEAMPVKYLNYWKEHIPGALYGNLYGPTEITDICTYYVVDRDFKTEETIPMGKPCKNMEVFLIDDNGMLVQETGKQGELFVRGTGLSVGYWNNSEKTKEVFVQNPLHSKYRDVVYKTGDLAKYDGDGNLIYIGRCDFQIKHQGHRIELGDIEKTLIHYIPEIYNCAAIYNKETKTICLFYEASEEFDILRREKELLPSYMVPGKNVYMKKLPLTDSGKVNRVKLKELEEQI